ncbi:MAG: PSD1 and planctomycete cytochrome C domain-containing protein [Pirellulales bacterium]
MAFNKLLLLRSAVLLLVAGLCGARSNAPDPAAVDHFERKVRPLLMGKCVECHGDETHESDLRLDTAEGLFRGGATGAAVVPGDLEKSRVIELVRGRGSLQMPPDDRLSPEEISALEEWVAAGAVWPGYDPASRMAQPSDDPLQTQFTPEQNSYWAFQPVRDPPLPEINARAWPSSPIDYFILARLEAAGTCSAPRADKRTLLRRVTYDLTGLPTTPDEMRDFLSDETPDALERVVDRLLASERYGEKWGQHWLDVARFGESAAHDGNNAYLHAWRYRDYVIDSFNADKPYNQFVIEQLAGDLLPKTGDCKADYDQVVATGFLQVGPKPVVMRDKRQMLLDIADEQLHTVGVAFLGLTLGCARCHDHKFDPIPTADYYSLAGIFTSTHVMADDLPDSKWVEFPIAGPAGEEVKVMAVRDLPHPKNLAIHRRGNYRALGPEAPRRFLQIVAGENHPPINTMGSGRLELARWIADPHNPLTARVMVNRIWQHHFGRGLVETAGNFGTLGSRPSHPDLLDWLATRFVESGWSVKTMHRMVVLSSTYQQAHLENSAAKSVDAENVLLWRMPRRRLTAEEIRDSILTVSGRLDLTKGGTLFSEGFTANDASRELFVVDISGKDRFPPFEHPRRSVYLPVIRNSRPESLKLFDAANELEPAPVRGETTVAPQALFMLNSPFAREQAAALAMQVLNNVAKSSAQNSTDEALTTLYFGVLGRNPTDEERIDAMRFLADYTSQFPEGTDRQDLFSRLQQEGVSDVKIETVASFFAWRALCQALFCTNEFLYLE